MSLSFGNNTVGMANYTQKDYLIDILKNAISKAEKFEEKRKNIQFFKSSLANARGTLAGLNHPPYANVSDLPYYKDVERICFNLLSSIENDI